MRGRLQARAESKAERSFIIGSLKDFEQTGGELGNESPDLDAIKRSPWSFFGGGAFLLGRRSSNLIDYLVTLRWSRNGIFHV